MPFLSTYRTKVIFVDSVRQAQQYSIEQRGKLFLLLRNSHWNKFTLIVSRNNKVHNNCAPCCKLRNIFNLISIAPDFDLRCKICFNAHLCCLREESLPSSPASFVFMWSVFWPHNNSIHLWRCIIQIVLYFFSDFFDY